MINAVRAVKCTWEVTPQKMSAQGESLNLKISKMESGEQKEKGRKVNRVKRSVEHQADKYIHIIRIPEEREEDT